MKDEIGTVYLIHFSEPFGHAKHYTGWARSVKARFAYHQKGQGANLTKLAVATGITLTLARTWENKTRAFERAKKGRGITPSCPTCKAAAKLAVA